MISLTKQDIELALDQIDKDGIPARNRSTGHCLVARNNHHYPPKHVLRLAYKSKGQKLPKGLGGGAAVKKQLELIGYYKIVPHNCRNDNLRITD